MQQLDAWTATGIALAMAFFLNATYSQLMKWRKKLKHAEFSFSDGVVMAATVLFMVAYAIAHS